MEDSEDEDDSLVEEDDEVEDLSIFTIVGYPNITREISHNCSVRVHTVLQFITMSIIVHN